MNSNSIKVKIAEIIEAAKKRNWVNYELQAEHSLSLSYPEGETAYFKKKIFDLKEQILTDTQIGRQWTEANYQPDIFNSKWPQIHTELLLKYNIDENEAFRQMKLFIDQCIQLSNYENIVRENEAPEIVNSEYTVKSVCIAYLYMYKKGIYPIPEISEAGKKLKFYQKLADTYGLSFDSFRTDWKPLEDKNNRLKQAESIKLAIKLLGTFDDIKIRESIDLANNELMEAILKN